MRLANEKLNVLMNKPKHSITIVATKKTLLVVIKLI